MGIPPARDTDAEDVAWGLQTADTLWKRGERIDAVVWLRRAAQSAGEASDDDRALELARSAAELSDWMASGGSEAPPPVARSGPPTFIPDGERNPRNSIDVELDEPASARSAPLITQPPVTAPPAATAPPPALRPMPPQSRPPSQPTMQTAQPSFEDAPADSADPAPSGEPSSGQNSVPPAEQVHAGLFNPWDERGSALPSAPEPVPPPPLAPTFGDDEEVVTSVRSAQLHAQRAELMAAVLAGTRVPSTAPSARPSAWAEDPKPEPPRSLPPRPGGGKPPPLPPRALKKPPVPVAPAPLRVRSEPPPPPSDSTLVATSVITPPPSDATLVAAPAHTPPPPSPTDVTTSAPAIPAATAIPAAVSATHGPPDLEAVEAFADLPDDARTAFAAAAQVSALAEGEEVSSFALAYILSGSVDVAATMVDAPAARLEQGAVLRSRGTTDDGVPMRLIGVSSGVVATWTDAAVTEAFRTCPWVEEDLRVAADRLQTLVGVTIGPLGERLDGAIREQIIGKLTMRTLMAGEIVVTGGELMPGLLLVGVGKLELFDGEKVTGEVGSGEFVFPTEVLGAGKAPLTARAGQGGALVLFGDRMIAQELLVTCPPLLEVFAGM
ncbi:MAG: putative type pilus assembly FimV-related transrane protein [Labilithrix sp.]|nr:putative type pilus assembly FimV-related transrane protein [Labilithrix sp.]